MANLQQYILDKLKDFQRKASSGIDALTTPLPPPVNVLKNYTPQNQRQQQAYDQAQPYIQQAQQQYEKPSVQLPNLAANTFQDINNYFQPTQNVRFRDFARELPGAGAQIGKDILQSSARYTGGFGLGVGRELLKPLGSEKFIPETIDTSNSPLGQFVFGGKPVPLTKTGIASQTLQDLGINQETSQRVAQSNLGTPIALAGVAMNVLGNGKGASKFANIIAKETDVAKIASKLKGLGLADNVVREISPTLAKTSKINDVQAILKNVTKESAGLSVKNVSATPLYQEARKYSTPEEFVKAQRKMFRGTALPQKGDIDVADTYGLAYGKGAYLASDESFARQYGSNISELYPNLRKPFVMNKEVPSEVLKQIKKDFPSYNEKYGTTGEDIHSFIGNQDEANEYLQKLGYDGLLDAASEGSRQTVVFDPKNVLTKSQLTDIWNKANAGSKVDPLIAEARKYKSAEEFVRKAEFEVPIKSILPTEGHTLKAMKGKLPAKGYEKQPIRVEINKEGKLQIQDGNRRYYQALERGDKNIKVVFNDQAPDLNFEGEFDRLTDIWNKANGTVNPRIGQNTTGLDSGLGTVQQEAPVLSSKGTKLSRTTKGESVAVKLSSSTGIPSPQDIASAIEGKIAGLLPSGREETLLLPKYAQGLKRIATSKTQAKQILKETGQVPELQLKVRGGAKPMIGAQGKDTYIEFSSVADLKRYFKKTGVAPQNFSIRKEGKFTFDGFNITPKDMSRTIPEKLNAFIKEVAGYSTNTPEITGKGANIYTRTLRNAQGRLGTNLEHALGSSNPLIRNATAIMQDFFRGISMSPGRQAASADLRGGLAVSNQRAYDVMTALYDSLKGNGKSLERINAVLDPELAKTKVSFNDLNATEKQVYGLIRKGLDLVHDISYASGAISPETYKANLGKYTPRLYQPFELPEEVSKWVNSSTRKIQNDLYKSKTDINAWKTENALNDPVYALGKRLSQVQSNQAIRGYIDYLATQPQLVSDVEKAGFTKLSDSPLYGPLAGKYVLNSAAEELKGSFFANQALQNLYDVFRAYDRLSIRQLQKKLLTVFNPTTNVGNIVSDNVFGFMVGVDPLTLNKNIYKLARNKAELKTISDYLMRKGIIGTDITRTDFTSKIGSIDSLAQTKGVVKGLKALPDKVTQFYSGTDDMYKAGAFKALLEKGYSLDEATKLVGDAFQNYASVGKFYDVWAKTPIFGKAFIKFQGDLMRIIKNAAVNRPLHLITFLGTLYGIAQLSSKLSGETPENKKARETRFGAPTIPGLNIPLTWQTPWGEINVARYISPFYANNAGGDNTPLGIAGKLLPGVPDLNFTKGGGLDIQKTIAKSAGDPLLGPLTQFGVNADFRGKPILDPNENKYQPSTLTPGEKTLNGATWLARAYTPPVPNSLINIGSAIQGKPDQYGSVRSVPQAIARAAGIKVQTYGPEQVKQQQQKDLEFQDSANKSVQKQINQVKKEQLQGKITAEQAANRINYLQQQIVPLDGITPEVGNIVSYLDKNGSLVNVNVQKVIDMKDGTNYEKQLKQQEAFKLVKPLLESGKSDQEIANLLNQVGISKQDADYYMIAKQSSDAKIAYISDQLQNVPPDQLIPTLEGFRKEVGGASILTTTGINTLYQEGVITYAEKKYLSSLSYDKKTKTLKAKKTSPKKPKKPKKVSISLGKVPRISVAKFQKPRKPRYRKLKAVTFKPVKISIPKQNKVKLPTVQDYKNILKVAK